MIHGLFLILANHKSVCMVSVFGTGLPRMQNHFLCLPLDHLYVILQFHTIYDPPFFFRYISLSLTVTNDKTYSTRCRVIYTIDLLTIPTTCFYTFWDFVLQKISKFFIILPDTPESHLSSLLLPNMVISPSILIFYIQEHPDTRTRTLGISLDENEETQLFDIHLVLPPSFWSLLR